MPELRKRTCCAKYKKQQRYKPLWTLPWLYCSKPAHTIEFSSDGERVAYLCKVHKNTKDINWQDVDPAQLSPAEIQAWKVVLEACLKHCEERLEAWTNWRAETKQRIEEIERSAKDGNLQQR